MDQQTEDLPAAMNEWAQSKVDAFEHLQAELQEHLTIIHERTELVKQKLLENIQSSNTPNGLLL